MYYCVGDKICKNFRDNTECLLKSLPDFGRKESYREIPASTKPLSSTIKWIIEYHSMELSNKAKTILENNFSQTDILYLTDEKRYCSIKSYKLEYKLTFCEIYKLLST